MKHTDRELHSFAVQSVLLSSPCFILFLTLFKDIFIFKLELQITFPCVVKIGEL
jgi:hypothetical protein